MSIEKNKAVLRRQLEAFGPGNLKVLDQLADELYTPDYVIHDPGSPALPPGPEGVKQFMHGFFATYPDGYLTIKDLVAERDKVAARFVVHGTHTSTGKPVTILVMTICRFVGGRIAEEWQLGIPVEAQP